MRSKLISLLDIGLDDAFDASMTFVQSTLQNINAGLSRDICEISYVRSRDLNTVASAFTSQCDVLHVMSHTSKVSGPRFVSSDGKLHVTLDELGRLTSGQLGAGIQTSTVLADGCNTGTGVWQKAVRDCLQGPVTYIGTTSLIGWHESTVFCSAFYGSLFRNRGKGKTSGAQSQDAAERAIKAYEILTDRKCPYKVFELKPSRRAQGRP